MKQDQGEEIAVILVLVVLLRFVGHGGGGLEGCKEGGGVGRGRVRTRTSLCVRRFMCTYACMLVSFCLQVSASCPYVRVCVCFPS
jgi:hypothetical protein